MISDPRPYRAMLQRSASVQNDAASTLRRGGGGGTSGGSGIGGVGDGLSTSWADGELASRLMRNGGGAGAWNGRMEDDDDTYSDDVGEGYDGGAGRANGMGLETSNGLNGHHYHHHVDRQDVADMLPPYRGRCASANLPGGRPTTRDEFNAVRMSGSAVNNNNSSEHDDLEWRRRLGVEGCGTTAEQPLAGKGMQDGMQNGKVAMRQQQQQEEELDQSPGQCCEQIQRKQNITAAADDTTQREA